MIPDVRKSLSPLDGGTIFGDTRGGIRSGLGRFAEPMSKFYRFDDFRKSSRKTFFDRNELNQLLALYSKRVSTGEWRDYAIDQAGAAAIFSIFRHTHDSPLFAIAKQTAGQSREYVVFSGREKLTRAKTLSEALSVFEQSLRVVS